MVKLLGTYRYGKEDFRSLMRQIAHVGRDGYSGNIYVSFRTAAKRKFPLASQKVIEKLELGLA